MRDPNPRVRARERFQLSLDGRQVAATVVAALVVLGVVFVLGLNVGKQIASRRGEVVRAGDLDALDRVPAAPAPARPEPLTFHDRLTKEKPAPPPPADAPAKPAPAPAPAPAAPVPAPLRPWTVQLAAAEDRAEAERLATRFAALGPRIEEAVIPGKGRFFRVRVGSFDTKDAAQRYLRDVGRETGAKGIVTPSR
jgi:cell division septation protein DedD